jgi:hypothetical protein
MYPPSRKASARQGAGLTAIRRRQIGLLHNDPDKKDTNK